MYKDKSFFWVYLFKQVIFLKVRLTIYKHAFQKKTNRIFSRNFLNYSNFIWNIFRLFWNFYKIFWHKFSVDNFWRFLQIFYEVYAIIINIIWKCMRKLVFCIKFFGDYSNIFYKKVNDYSNFHLLNFSTEYFCDCSEISIHTSFCELFKKFLLLLQISCNYLNILCKILSIIPKSFIFFGNFGNFYKNFCGFRTFLGSFKLILFRQILRLSIFF